MYIKAFYEISSSDFSEKLKTDIKNEIQSKTKNYILNVNGQEYVDYLFQEYKLEPLLIDKESEEINNPSKSIEWFESEVRRVKYQKEVYNFFVDYKFEGSSVLFQIRPSQFVMTTTEINVDELRGLVSFKIKLNEQNPTSFNTIKSNLFRKAFTNLNNVNRFANSWNKGLRNIISIIFNTRKNALIKENQFFKAINLKVNENSKQVFSVPAIKKRKIPQPSIPSNKKFSSEPILDNSIYEDILETIYSLGKRMEQKPSTYHAKDEEALRDHFLLFLETRYDGTTATAETFNKGGRSDILLKYVKDGSNLFVAECKFWHGASEFLGAISQLFDRYLTWRDSKTALIIFVKNKSLTKVIETVKSEIQNHPYYINENGTRGESSLSYVFCLPQDAHKKAYLEVILFHYI